MEDAQFYIDNFLPARSILYMHNVSTELHGKKETVTMIAGILPGLKLDRLENGRDKQQVIHGEIIFSPHLQIPCERYYGWRLDQIITDPDWVRGGLFVDEFKELYG